MSDTEIATYDELAVMTGRTKDSLQGLCLRYADKAPKPVDWRGQQKIFRVADMLAFLRWYDEANVQATETGGKRSPRTPVEVSEATLIRLKTRRDKALRSIERKRADLAKSEAELAETEARIVSEQRTLKRLRLYANGN